MSTTTGSVDGLTCLEYMRCLISEELQHDLPDLVIISISLGIIEESLTNKAHQSWPAEFKVNYAEPDKYDQVFIQRAHTKRIYDNAGYSEEEPSYFCQIC